MSISGEIICYQLACPPHHHHDDKNSIDIILKCYRINENESNLTIETLLFQGERIVVDRKYSTVKLKLQMNRLLNEQPLLYKFNYTIENLSQGIYSIFAYEDNEETWGSYIDPLKQAFGWSTSEKGGKWTQHSIVDSNSKIENIDIILRKPHSLFDINYPISTSNARFIRMNEIPVLQFNAANLVDRGYSHGYLLAPHILDWFSFYLIEENFQSTNKYEQFYAMVDPTSNFFHYPNEYLLEMKGILQGMKSRTDCDLFLYELNRTFDLIDLLAMNSFIERRTVKEDLRVNDPNCSQIILWNSLTDDRRMIAGRNMDGECDIRRVTVSTILLFAVNSIDPSKEYRYVSLSWPGMIGVLSGINQTGFYSMENAGPSQMGGQIRGLTPVSYVATHLLRTINARQTTKDQIQSAFENFAPDSKLNNDPKVWPTNRVYSDLKGSVCGPGSIFVLNTMSNEGSEAFVLEGDRYGGRIRTSMQTSPFISDCILATNHFHLYDYTDSTFSSLHRYESMRHRLEMMFSSSLKPVHFNVEDIRSLIQSACEGRTEYAIEIEIELNGRITLHIQLAKPQFGLWYAPYEHAKTILFEQLFS